MAFEAAFWFFPQSPQSCRTRRWEPNLALGPAKAAPTCLDHLERAESGSGAAFDALSQ